MLPPLISPVSRMASLMVATSLYPIVEDHSQTFAHVRGREAVEALPAFTCKSEAHVRLAILVGARLGVPQVLTSHSGNAGHETPSLLRSICALSAHEDRVRRRDSALFLQSRLLALIRPAGHLLDLKHGGGLHDVLDPAGIIHAGQLH